MLKKKKKCSSFDDSKNNERIAAEKLVLNARGDTGGPQRRALGVNVVMFRKVKRKKKF